MLYISTTGTLICDLKGSNASSMSMLMRQTGAASPRYTGEKSPLTSSSQTTMAQILSKSQKKIQESTFTTLDPCNLSPRLLFSSLLFPCLNLFLSFSIKRNLSQIKEDSMANEKGTCLTPYSCLGSCYTDCCFLFFSILFTDIIKI